MKFLDKLTTKPQIFQRTIGLSLEQFKILAQQLQIVWNSAEIQRKTRDYRKIKIGGGRAYKLPDIWNIGLPHNPMFRIPICLTVPHKIKGHIRYLNVIFHRHQNQSYLSN